MHSKVLSRGWLAALIAAAGLFIALVAVPATASGEMPEQVDADKETRALIRDVRAYLRQLDRIGFGNDLERQW